MRVRSSSCPSNSQALPHAVSYHSDFNTSPICTPDRSSIQPHSSNTTPNMPPRRSSRPNQATLSFGSHSRVTKPSTHAQKQKPLDAATPVSEKPSAQPEQTPVTPTEPSQPHVAELAVRDQAKTEIQQPWSDEDDKAIKLTENDLRKYWQREEKNRRAPRG